MKTLPRPTRRRRRRAALLPLSAVALAALVACGSDDAGARPVGATASPGTTSASDSSTSFVVATSEPTETTAAPVSPLPTGGTIVFQDRVVGEDRIGLQLVGADGSEQRTIADDVVSGLQRHGDWSPDGSQLVFTAADDQGSDDLWRSDAAGGSAMKLVECEPPCLGVDEAAWSPDGRTIVFWRLVQPADAVTSTLETIDVASGAVTTLYTAPPDSVLLAPRWSPDGRRLVVEWLQLDGPGADAVEKGDLIGIFDLDQPEAGVQPLTEPAQWANNPDWSRDGQWLLYAARVPGKGTFQDLYVSRPDGTQVRRITMLADGGDMAVQPTFSPDGRFVLFALKPDGGQKAYLAVVDLGDGAVARIGGDHPISGEHPRLRPEP